jgi:hypothetical protein
MGGAFLAFSGISAAYAEPATANMAAAKTNFFIKSPQRSFPSQRPIDRTPAELR